jgi:hypothetical protein
MGEKTARRTINRSALRLLNKPRFGGVFLSATDERYKVTTDDVPYIPLSEVAAQVGNSSEK